MTLIMTQISSASELSKLKSSKTKPLYPLPVRFYVNQFIVLLVLAAVFTWLSRDETLDRVLTGYWFDAASQHFPLQQNALLDLLNHRLAKYLTITLAAGMLLYGIWRRNAQWVTGALLMGLGTAVVGILKATSHHSCPWTWWSTAAKRCPIPCLTPPLPAAAWALFSGRARLKRLYGDGAVLRLLA